MIDGSIVVVACLGVVGGFAAGLLGVGGGVLLFPLLLYVPPFLGFETLDARTVASLVISQVFFSSLIAGAAHWRSGRVNGWLAVIAAVTAATGSFVGGVYSKSGSERFLLVLFGVVTLLAAAMMFLPAPSLDREGSMAKTSAFPVVPVGVLSFLTGTVVGFLGAGNFVFIPLLIYVLKVPTRVAIGTNLVIASVSTLSGFLGKLVMGQIPFLMTLGVVIGASLGALGGEWRHSWFSPISLRYVYGAVVGIVGVTVWISILR
jgi:uncharacterized membrane protein YfcA